MTADSGVMRAAKSDGILSKKTIGSTKVEEKSRPGTATIPTATLFSSMDQNVADDSVPVKLENIHTANKNGK